MTHNLLRRTVAVIPAFVMMVSGTSLAEAAKIQTASGGTIASNAITFFNAGSAAGSHVFVFNGVYATCSSASFANVAALVNGTRTLAVKPTFSGCALGGIASATITCGTWTFSIPAPPPEDHNSTTGATTGLMLTFSQGPVPTPVGYACRLAASTCAIDVATQTLASGITSRNVNQADTADVGDASAAGLRLQSDTPATIKYQAVGCGFVGVPNGARADGEYWGGARATGSGSTPRIWVLPG